MPSENSNTAAEAPDVPAATPAPFDYQRAFAEMEDPITRAQQMAKAFGFILECFDTPDGEIRKADTFYDHGILFFMWRETFAAIDAADDAWLERHNASCVAEDGRRA